MKLTIYSDGGARGNPGPSAFAVVVCEGSKVIHEHSEYIGRCTNNEAEYRGLINAAGYALKQKADDVEFVMDSELVIKQMTGEYKVKSERMKELNADATSLTSQIPKRKFRNVRREDLMITRADALLNAELDRHR